MLEGLTSGEDSILGLQMAALLPPLTGSLLCACTSRLLSVCAKLSCKNTSKMALVPTFMASF